MGPLSVVVSRGGVVEARHRVHAVAVQGRRLVVACGDPDLVALLRSCAKPFQALPLARARPDLDRADLAVACASHQAEPAQLAAVRRLLRAAQAGEDDLECGLQEGRARRPLHHNCSGKHAGFLLACRARGWPRAGYRALDHPLQREVLTTLAGAAGVSPSRLRSAADGCGVPTFALSLQRMASAFVRLPSLEGAAQVLAAMQSRPDLVGGRGALDTALMQSLPGWTAKRGAEGLLCALSPEGIGLALKVEDGNPRALPPALARLLSLLGVELGEELEGATALLDARGERVGEVAVA
jgi:L-asparaginase II